MNKFVYMDAAASWLKPQSLIENQAEFLHDAYANAGRGICVRAGNVDKMIACSRKKVADFIGVNAENIIFTSGATDALNRIVNILSSQPGYSESATFAVSDLEHHSARLPWEELLMRGKIHKEFVYDLDENFNINIDSIPKTDFLIITAMSNVLGLGQDVESIIRVARLKNPNVITIVDASQYVAHKKIDVKKWDCDFCAFSGHKIGSDTGIGVMYIKNPEKWNPDKFGGGMVNRIMPDKIIFNKSPDKFEAGTLPITQIIGLPYAIDYCSNWNGGRDLIHYMYDELSKLKNIKILTSRDASMISFVPTNMHVIDFGSLIGANNICVRVGNMCASWIHQRFGVDGSVRISVGPWNTMDDAICVVDVIKNLVK